MILKSVIGVHVEQHEKKGWTSLSSLCNMANLPVKAPNLQWQQACLAGVVSLHPSAPATFGADFWLRLTRLLEFVLMELDPLHCLLEHFTNKFKFESAEGTLVLYQKSEISIFPHVGTIQPALAQASSCPSFLSLCGSGYLQGFCKDPASNSQGIYLRLITWKFLKYQVILNHTVLPQENCFTYIKYIRLSKSPLLQNLFISKCHLLLGGFFSWNKWCATKVIHTALLIFQHDTQFCKGISCRNDLFCYRDGVKFKCSVIK